MCLVREPASTCTTVQYHSEAAQAALLAWVPISSRLASVRLKATTVNLTGVAVYAPTDDATEDAKGSFHDDI